jgi:hypothetical protein
MKLPPAFLDNAGPNEWEQVLRLARRNGVLKAVYRNYLASTCWQSTRDRRMAMSGGLCVLCRNPATEVHHVTYANVPREKTVDIVPLCRECHEEQHAASRST